MVSLIFPCPRYLLKYGIITSRETFSAIQRFMRLTTKLCRSEWTFGSFSHFPAYGVIFHNCLNLRSILVFKIWISGTRPEKKQIVSGTILSRSCEYFRHKTMKSSAGYTRRSLFPLDCLIVIIPFFRSTSFFLSLAVIYSESHVIVKHISIYQ